MTGSADATASDEEDSAVGDLYARHPTAVRVGVILAALALVFIVVVACCCCFRNRRSAGEEEEKTKDLEKQVCGPLILFISPIYKYDFYIFLKRTIYYR